MLTVAAVAEAAPETDGGDAFLAEPEPLLGKEAAKTARPSPDFSSPGTC